MNWLKDKVGGRNGVSDKDNFLVGSDKWMGNSPATPSAPLASFKEPQSGDPGVQKNEETVNPYGFHRETAASGLASDSSPTGSTNVETRQPLYPDIYGSTHAPGYREAAASGPASDPSLTGSPNAEPRQPLYPDIYGSTPATAPGSNGEVVELLTGEEELVTIPGAIVHLINQQESVHLATGNFSVVRFVQEKTKMIVIIKVGEELKWPLVQEMSTVKLDPTHYYFSMEVPQDIDQDESASNKSPLENTPGHMETLNYGVTFPAGMTDDQIERLRLVDQYLERYSSFSAPTVVQKDPNFDRDVRHEENLPSPEDPNFPGKVIPAQTLASDGKIVTEETSAAFWTTIAPNVDDYNSSAAKGIATGAGHIIRGIIWLGDSTVVQLDSGHMYLTSKLKPKKESSKIGPTTIANMRRVRKLTGMTDKVAKGLLGGIVYTTGLFSNAVINSRPGKAFFKLLPGEIALVSLDAFGRVFDAVEKAGTDVMAKSSSVTQDFVNYRYGEAAKELTGEVNKTFGNVASTAWTFTKIRKAFNPKNFVSKTAMLKAAAQQTAQKNKV